ncbi:MAG: amino acid adenylation domain-containing protein [Ruminococcus sp.]
MCRKSGYNIPCLYKLGKNVDLNKLKSAVECTINAHPYIKTKLFLNENGDIRAKRNDEEKPIVKITQCAELAEPEKLVVPFGILDSSLYRAEIYKTLSGNYLFLDLHHIIADGTSEVVIIEDINSFYNGNRVEKESYTGFEAALDEDKLRKTDAYTKAKKYYDSIFEGCDSDFLPAKDKNEPMPTVGNCQLECDLPVERVKKFCSDNDITLNAFFNGVFGFVLSKYTYKDEALYTTLYNGRSDSRLSRAVTMLVKTFPVYCKTDGEKKITDLLKEIKTQIMQSMSNDIYSFAEISRAYNIKADIMFVYQGDNFEFNILAGEKTESTVLNLNAAKAPISINVYIKNNKFVFVSDYRSDMYSENAMLGMSECLCATAEEFLNKTYLKEVSMLSQKSKELLKDFNNTDVPFKQTTCNRLFEEQADKNPNKTAVIANKVSLTYKELNENANRIAHSLINSGVKPDDMVGVMMPRTVYAYAARQGVLKAGGAFMPLDPKYPDDRISYIFEDSKSKLVVTTEQIANERKALFENCGVTVLVLEEMLKCNKTENPTSDITPHSLCYCIYTSGSTGKPKGVMIEHHSLVNFVDYNRVNVQSCEFCDNMSVSLALAALTFDVSVLEETLPLYHGATVAMANEDEINNPILLAQMLIENKVDVMKCTPSYMNNMLDVPQVVEALKNMKAIDIGAEAFPAPLYDKMRKAGITAKIHNGYGPTEATITTSIDVVENNKITIGKPLCNTKVYMLDKNKNILPANVPGELTILGECVGRGYVGREELTGEKFITFENQPAYRSGDLARWGYDGKIYFMGRMDNQVKLRGLRVELDEIENVMNDYPAVLRSVVLVKENPQAGQFLCGYFTASETVDKDKLTEHMKRSLTHYMIPSVLIQLDSIPLTNNGKVNKQALPEPEFTVKEREYIAPENDLQKKLCEMFANALGSEKVGINENFFEIGGTSLSASKIAMRAMTENLPVAYSDIFDNPTVEMLEKHILKNSGKTENKAEMKEEVKLEGVDRVLQYNTEKYVDDVEYTDIGNVLLTGATGFLGIHILAEIIKHTKSKVYCLVRKGKSQSVELRLKNMLVYYFSDAMDDIFGKRIVPVEGDITDKKVIDSLEKYDFKTVINCAASVKHFTNDDTLEKINVQGVENLVSFCTEQKRRLVQISTISVAGENVNRKFSPEKKICENELYFGQDLSNKYVDTKFRAEKAVLEAAANKGLDGKIIRVGNLMSRQSDGEFQINSITNGFMRKLRGYAAIGKFPISSIDKIVEFSPIDFTAAAVMCLAGTNSKFTVYHACNGHRVEMGDVIEALNKCGVKIDVVKDEQFKEALSHAMKDDKKNMLISGLISYMSSNSENTRELIGYDNSFTIKVLYRLGFKWPITNERYLENAFTALDTLGYFDGRFN